jgi:pyruvate/2-oxoacid:ferredoxin oxidoreductase alpha subunit
VFDTIIQAYALSEKILLPVMINLEGFILSHTYEVVDIPKQKQIDSFLPPAQSRHCLDVEDPVLMGGTADLYINFRYKLHQAMGDAIIACKEIDTQFQRNFDRGYGLIQPYYCEDSDIILVTAGTIAGTCKVVSDRYRKSGLNIGVLRIRLFRPFPKDQICQVLAGAKKVAVIDRDFSPGSGGVIAQEVKSALQGLRAYIPVYEYIAGLGGQDITDDTIETIINHTDNTQEPEGCTWIGLLK